MFKVSPSRYKMFIDAQSCSRMLLNCHKGQPRGFLRQSRSASFLCETGPNNPQSRQKTVFTGLNFSQHLCIIWYEKSCHSWYDNEIIF